MVMLNGLVKRGLYGIATLVIVEIFLSYFIEYSRPLPNNLTVFVIPSEPPPKEFYSSPSAYDLLQKGVPLAKMPLEMARNMNIPMAEESKNDFSCSHSTLSWWMIDNGMWPNYCRWNSRGEWQNSQWPRWLESILRSIGMFK